ncbi:MAG: TetR/AcrR family transcriptional regulator C-terminal domain-containing protein [Lachnospiraceae bacterium]|nr:TetR/AcrR family transcriptional regulator C-terminal domain-containing protein [Lachnospiraceae bacterium]
MEPKSNVEQKLAESFKRLALKSPIEKITIKEITDGAGVIRPTFYNHFQDKYELLEWIIRSEILLPVQQLMMEGQVSESLVRIFTNLKREKEFYRKVVRLEGQNSCEMITRKIVKEVLLGFINEHVGNRKAAQKGLTSDLIADYYAQSITFAIIEWIKLDMSLSPDQMADIFRFITSHTMDEVIASMR